ncbi:MAG: MBL fold metallo-hydrolase [Acidobacteriia bacterium]|nr:MBL fold metallo-hydrolase [Terriglobia bacterium]
MTLLEQIDQAPAAAPTLWWLGRSGFVLKYHSMIFYIDPYLTGSPLIPPTHIHHASMVLSTHAHAGHMDAATLLPLLDGSPNAKLLLPKSAAGHAHSLGISYQRMTTTDAGLRVEYFQTGDYIRIYSVPSAHPELEWTAIGGYPYLGYLIRCGGCTIYHAGDGVPYPDLAMHLRPYNVDVALLPVSGSANFHADQAAQLAEDIEASWIVPMHYDSPDAFLDHMLFHRPSQRFKIFTAGEGWQVP